MIDKTLGKKWSNFTTVAIVLFSYGGCLTFLLLISDQFKICMLMINLELFNKKCKKLIS